ncbi:MAG: tetratricopeptide repeat protein [Saprospiraceae bacterium]|nr:tetratricopeptide repeat protein [Saprospiraceae bacterium]MDW8229098.1 tetratricopeptide repeat protein [Saprospiraceae bacterium]
MTYLLKKEGGALFAAFFLSFAALAQTHQDGIVSMQLSRWDKAIQIYTQLTQKDPADQIAWLTLGSAYAAKGEMDKAKSAYESAVNIKPDGVYALIANARIQMLQGRKEEAEATLKKVDKLARKDVAARRMVGESFLYPIGNTKPDFARAEEELKKAAEISAKDFATQMALGYSFLERGSGGQAAVHYEIASTLEPKNPLPVFMLAKVYYYAKLNDKYLANLDKAISLQPNYSDALRAKAEFLYFEKQWQKALEAAKSLVNNAAEVTIDDETLLANLLYINKDCPACSALVEKILKKDPSRNYLRRLQAYCDYDNGRYPEGLQILEEFFQMVKPDKILPSDYEYLGKLQIKMKRDTLEAIRNYEKAIEMDPSLWPMRADIAKLYYSKKDYCNAAEAYQAYLDSLESAQDRVNTAFQVGVCYYYCTADPEHYQKAEKAFSIITELAPDAPVGWIWRAKSASKLEPDLAANPQDSTLIEKYGVAQPFFARYVEVAASEPEKNKKDLITSYEYLVFYYFLKKQDELAKEHVAKLLALQPDNPTALEIQKILQGETSPGGKTPKKGGGK